MATQEYDVSVVFATDRPVSDVVRLAALISQLVDGEAEVEFRDISVSRWRDAGGEECEDEDLTPQLDQGKRR